MLKYFSKNVESNLDLMGFIDTLIIHLPKVIQGSPVEQLLFGASLVNDMSLFFFNIVTFYSIGMRLHLHAACVHMHENGCIFLSFYLFLPLIFSFELIAFLFFFDQLFAMLRQIFLFYIIFYVSYFLCLLIFSSIILYFLFCID